MKKAGRKTLGVACPIFVAAIFSFIAFLLCACAAPPSNPPQITDVYSLKTVVEYDGLPHGIRIHNVLDSDVVYYSTDDGEWQTDKIEYVEQGDYKVRYKIVRSGFADFIGYGELSIVRAELDGISASDVTVIYDGQPHGISIDGLHPDDKVTYSPDNAFVDVGEYFVSYTVERDGAGSCVGTCKLTVLPDIIGDYVNAHSGILRVTENTQFDIAGNGVIDGRPFGVSDGIMTCDSEEYTRLGDDDKLYIFDVNSTRLYCIGGETAVFSISFRPTVLVADKYSLQISGDYNFVESIDTDGEITECNSEYSVAAAGKSTSIDIILSERGRKPLRDTEEIIVYDGSAHEISARYEGRAVYTINGVASDALPVVTDIGEYIFSVTVYSDVYLTETVEHKVTVVLNGAYYSSDIVIEFDGLKAVINNSEYTVDYAEKTLNGKTVTTADGCVIYGEARLQALDGGLLIGLDVNGFTVALLLDETKIDEIYLYIKCDGEGVRLRLEDWREALYSVTLEMFEISKAVVKVNGVAPFFDAEAERYVFTPSELNSPVSWLTVEIE